MLERRRLYRNVSSGIQKLLATKSTARKGEALLLRTRRPLFPAAEQSPLWAARQQYGPLRALP